MAQQTKKNKHIAEKIVVMFLVAVVMALLVFFFADVFIPFIRAEFAQDVEGAKQLLIDKGFLGAATVSLIEALQMVVIFIPAEFIQLSSGMSYPWYLALILCDIGVIIGSSIIYFIVHVLKFDADIFHRSDKLVKYDKKRTRTEKGVMILMYFLFVMPIIPFGAICYYASHKKIRYSRYVFTCATGVIPSISTSILMGTAVKEFISNSIPLIILILIIVLSAAILFVLILFILRKFYFKEYDNTPDSPYFSLMRTISKIFLFGKCRLVVEKDENYRKANEIEGPFLLLMNHGTPFDFFFASEVCPEKTFAFVINRHIYNYKRLKPYLVKCGVIPKKLLDADMGTIKGIIKTIKDGYPVIMFPEGRLSVDGTTNHINPAVSKLIKKLNVPVVLSSETNGYMMKPKWRKSYMLSTVDVKVKQVLYPEDINKMTEDEVTECVNAALKVNCFEKKHRYFKRKNKAKGLENVLYACPVCGTQYSTAAEGNDLICSSCKTIHTIDENYNFKGGKFADIHEYYLAIKEFERKNVENVDISAEVSVKIFHENDDGFETDEGVFRLTYDKAEYIGSEEYSFAYPKEKLEGVAFSVGEEFEIYHNNRLYYFYPKDNPKLCARISTVYDVIKENETTE